MNATDRALARSHRNMDEHNRLRALRRERGIIKKITKAQRIHAAAIKRLKGKK